MSKKPKSEYTGTWVPAHIMDDEFLTSSSKLLYALIASFSACYASNNWLGAKLGITVRHVQRGVAELEERGYIARSGEDTMRILIALRDAPRHVGHGGGDIDVVPPMTSMSPNNKDNNKVEKVPPESSDHFDGQTVSPQAGEPGTAPAGRALLDEVIAIVNPREKPTADRLKNVNARLKEYNRDEILAAARAFSKSTWHKENNEMSVDNLIRPSKFGRWFNEGQKLLQRPLPSEAETALQAANDANENRDWGF